MVHYHVFRDSIIECVSRRCMIVINGDAHSYTYLEPLQVPPVSLFSPYN